MIDIFGVETWVIFARSSQRLWRQFFFLDQNITTRIVNAGSQVEKGSWFSPRPIGGWIDYSGMFDFRITVDRRRHCTL